MIKTNLLRSKFPLKIHIASAFLVVYVLNAFFFDFRGVLYWKRNTWVSSQTKVRDVIHKLKWECAGHIARRTEKRWMVERLK